MKKLKYSRVLSELLDSGGISFINFLRMTGHIFSALNCCLATFLTRFNFHRMSLSLFPISSLNTIYGKVKKQQLKKPLDNPIDYFKAFLKKHS